MRTKIMARLKVFMVAALLALAGCVALNKINLASFGLGGDLEIYQQRPIRFSHATHAVKEKLECTSCHTKAKDEDKAGMPGMGACKNCHDSKEKVDQFLRPFLVDDKVMFTSATKISEDVNFSHKKHVEAGTECQTCHEGILESEAVSSRVKVGKDDCLTCHAQKQIKGDCKSCHREIDQDWKPGTHDQAWEKMHGETARAGYVPPDANRCSMCHTDSDCSDCHQNEPPQNHNQHWRERAHGFTASMDRSNCAVCHRADYCDRCHHDTEPKNHRAGWGGSRNRHCMNCHFPMQTNNCGVCHEGSRGHLLAPALPTTVTHVTAQESACRTCHAATGYHLDSGDACRTCHR